MNIPFQKTGLWVIMAVSIFSIFRWLFGMAIPEAAFEFAISITFILMSGLLSGRYVSQMWFKLNHRTQNILLLALTVAVFIGCIGIGLLVNKMIDHTEFIHFSFAVLLLFLVNAFVGAIISLINNRIKNNILSAQTAMTQSKSELQLLQSQLSPHFLFNTLNNLYGLSISEHEKVPNLLLKLSGLLRYSVYEAKEMFVPLKDELDYLKNYIDFEKIRLGERLDFKSDWADLEDSSIKIAPMLLVVFVENAFKHSKNSQDKKIFIEIRLDIQQDTLLFTVINSHSKPKTNLLFKEKHSGFGLENVRKRLDLLYHNVHDLEIEESDKVYIVKLRLNKK